MGSVRSHLFYTGSLALHSITDPSFDHRGVGRRGGAFPFEMSILEELPTTSGGDRRHPQDKWALPEDEGCKDPACPSLT